MKAQLIKLQTEVDVIKTEVSLNREFKHTINNHIQAHTGKFSILEEQQKNVISELILIHTAIKEGAEKTNEIMRKNNELMEKTNELFITNMKIKFMLNGAGVISSAFLGLCGLGYYIVTLYLNYKK